MTFDWKWFSKLPTAHFVDARRRVRSLLGKIDEKYSPVYSLAWLEKHAEKLWETRELLVDEISRRQFDDAIVLKIVGYRRFYFYPEAFDVYIKCNEIKPFAHDELPGEYMGLPLYLQKVERQGHATIVANNEFVESVNRYRQYFVKRAGIDFAPQPGETVLDCGACIGEVATVFAMHVGERGQVHMFDPMPAHAAFCNLQKELNPHLAGCMHVAPMAVGAVSNGLNGKNNGLKDETVKIRPDAVPDDSFPFVSIDDYVKERSLRVDVIKMDIEGGEGDALKGAQRTLREMKPRLMISVYHKHDDLWALRERIQAANPEYAFYFGHHTPVQWESILYAV